jgi:spore coat protein A
LGLAARERKEDNMRRRELRTARFGPTTRRTFIQTSAVAGTALLVGGRRSFGQALDPIKHLTKFVDPLPLPGAGLSLATPNKTLYDQTGAQADFYRIAMGQFRQSFHRDLPPSKLWGYADATGTLPKWSYLGASIVAMKGTPVRISYLNLLPPIHPLPIDNTLPGAETGQKVNRAAPHLHGGFVVWPSDGGPFHWTTPLAQHGPSWVRWLPNRLGIKTDDYYYSNEQTARFMWYHDHAVGLTRLNAYAGLAAGYFLIDGDELRMFGSGGSVLPDQIPGIPLVLQDKSFKTVADAWGRVGDLDYPTDYGGAEEGFPGTPPPISAVPEFFADTPIINGKAYPELTLPAGVHRFRLLNATQSRVWNLQLYKEDAMNPGEADTTRKGPDFIQIGTEGGFLPRPAVVPSGNKFDPAKHNAHDTSGYSLVLAGAERADLLIDFSDCAGQSFILYNDALSPFPDGGDDVDYYTNSVDSDGVPNGAPDSLHGPNTRTLMRIKITPGSYTGSTGTALVGLLETELKNNDLGLLVDDAIIGSTFERPPGYTARNRTLSEGVDPYGRLIALLGTDFEGGQDNTVYGMHYLDPLRDEEKHTRGGCEVWDIYNTTGDTHPIHFHLFNVQILGRARFAQDGAGNPVGGLFAKSGPWVGPDPNERGFKETVRMNPGEVIRVVMKFDLPPDPVVNVLGRNRRIPVPESPRTGGLEYVWHCHILEHEEHDMMRPLVVF